MSARATLTSDIAADARHGRPLLEAYASLLMGDGLLRFARFALPWAVLALSAEWLAKRHVPDTTVAEAIAATGFVLCGSAAMTKWMRLRSGLATRPVDFGFAEIATFAALILLLALPAAAMPLVLVVGALLDGVAGAIATLALLAVAAYFASRFAPALHDAARLRRLPLIAIFRATGRGSFAYFVGAILSFLPLHLLGRAVSPMLASELAPAVAAVFSFAAAVVLAAYLAILRGRLIPA